MRRGQADRGSDTKLRKVTLPPVIANRLQPLDLSTRNEPSRPLAFEPLAPSQGHDELFADWPAELTQIQVLCLVSLLSGNSIAATARKHKLSRKAIHAWLRDDHHFVAALHRGRNELNRAVKLRLRSAVEMAAKNVYDAVQAGNLKLSWALLNAMGYFDGEKPMEEIDDPKRLEVRAQAAKSRQWLDDMG